MSEAAPGRAYNPSLGSDVDGIWRQPHEEPSGEGSPVRYEPFAVREGDAPRLSPANAPSSSRMVSGRALPEGGHPPYATAMPRTYGVEYPERPLMSILSDLLGIPHFTTSRGSTVRADFLRAVAEALGVPDDMLRGLHKDQVLARAVEAATRTSIDRTLFSPGGTVTNRALQTIIDGVVAHGVTGRPVLPNVPSQPVADEDATDVLSELFDVEAVKDERDRRLVEIAARQGQDRFRLAVLEAYGERCAITDYDAVETLEAAHIHPYRGPATNRVSNGLLLRADLHILYDRGAITVHETSYHVLVKPHLAVTRYAFLGDHGLRLPRRRGDRPSTAALRSHRLWAGL